LSTAVHEAFSNAYPDKEVPNKTTIHQQVTTFWDTRSVCDRKHVQNWTVFTGEMLCSTKETLVQLTTALLQNFFGECIVGRGLWPLQSPDLTPDFFLYGFLKGRVYSNNL
jgi:hypothetical protein